MPDRRQVTADVRIELSANLQDGASRAVVIVPNVVGVVAAWPQEPKVGVV